MAAHRSRTSQWRDLKGVVKEILGAGSTDHVEAIENADQVDQIEHVHSSGVELNIEHLLPLPVSNTYDPSSSDNYSPRTDSDIESSSSDDEQLFEESLWSKLASWSVRHKVSQVGATELLHILHEHGHSEELPRDARTLRGTLREVGVEDLCGGQYVHIGFAQGFNHLLNSCPDIRPDCLDLILNIDGLPLFKSTGTQLWPILCRVGSLPPFVVSLYCGDQKPDCATTFMKQCLDELDQLLETGFMHMETGIRYPVNLVAFVCDAPARQFLKGIKSHCGFHACERCTVRGTHHQNRVIFEEIYCPLREDSDFAACELSAHHVTRTPLIDHRIGCVTQFPLDIMHLVYLGVTKRMLSFLKEGPRASRLSQGQLSQMSDRLTSFSGIFPSEFARQPRSLDHLKRFKATELRQFLLYSGPVALKGIVSKNQYEHFLLLSSAIRILCCNEMADRIEEARALLISYVEKGPEIYSRIFTSYNVHSLIHLPDDAAWFNVELHKLSAFPFENFLQVIKKLVKSSKNPLSQVVKRLSELQSTSASINYKYGSTVLRCKEGTYKDSTFLSVQGDILHVKQVYCDGFLRCDVLKSVNLCNLFVEPVNSMSVGIYACKRKHAPWARCLKSRCDLKAKLVCLETVNDLVFIALLSELKWDD